MPVSMIRLEQSIVNQIVDLIENTILRTVYFIYLDSLAHTIPPVICRQ